MTEFSKQLNEHFFLTDPDEFIYTHFPYDEVLAISKMLFKRNILTYFEA